MGWNPGLHDAGCYCTTDPEGFLIGYLGDEAIATISAVKYGRSFGFLGFYIVKAAYRDQGYGIQLWNAAIGSLCGRNMGLDGVVEQQDNYKKSGFRLAYRNIRFGVETGEAAPDSEHIVELASLPFRVVDAYDQPFFPENRTAFIQSWINQPESVALGFMDGANLARYGVICRSGYKIGPLFADTPAIGEALFLALQAKVSADEPVFLDVPEVNGGGVPGRATQYAHGV